MPPFASIRRRWPDMLTRGALDHSVPSAAPAAKRWPALAAALTTALVVSAALHSVRGATVTVSREGDFDVSASPAEISDHARLVVAADGTVHVVWEEGLNIYHRYRAPDGAWATPILLFYGARQPAIAAHGTTVAVAFVRDGREEPFSDTEVYVQVWDSAGSQWAEQAIPVDASEQGQQPDVAFSPMDGSLWVTWSDFSYDGGRPYLAQLQGDPFSGTAWFSASTCGDFAAAESPTLAIDVEGSVHVARTDMLHEGGEAEIALATRRSGTTSCQEGPILFHKLRAARNPDVVASDDALCLTWQEGTAEGGEEIILACRSGSTWEAWNMSASSAVSSGLPRLVLDPTVGALTAWQEHFPNRDHIMFRQNPPPSDIQNVTNGRVEAESPDIFYRRGYVHAAWTEWSDDGADVQYAQWRVEPPTPTPTATATATATATSPSATATEGTEATPSATATPRDVFHVFIPFASRPD